MLNNNGTIINFPIPPTIRSKNALNSKFMSYYDDRQDMKSNFQLANSLKSRFSLLNIAIHVSMGNVQLAGFVDNIDQYRGIQQEAAKIKDRYHIFNNVKVLAAKDSLYEQMRLSQDIKDKLESYRYPIESIDVQARNGYVILSGFVMRHVPISHIVRISKSVPGAAVVDSYIMILQS